MIILWELKMNIQMFNGWYFLMLFICIGAVVGLYFILRNKSEKTQKIVLFLILLLGLILHFLKCFIPPYSTDNNRLLRDIFFINICGANIFLFPFIFLSKSEKAKDYMFYIGVLSGLISIFYPAEPMAKVNQASEWLDILRFYFHHTMLWAVPLLMVVFKLHKLNYRRVIYVPIYLLSVMLFIMVNQVLQSELGFIPLRGNDIFNINYKNSSMIWGPSGAIGDFLAIFCPDFFKYIPVGEHAGEPKYWPWFWLIFPAFIILVPVSFLISLIFDFKRFKNDMQYLKLKFNQRFYPNKVINEEGYRVLSEKESNKIIENILKTHNYK